MSFDGTDPGGGSSGAQQSWCPLDSPRQTLPRCLPAGVHLNWQQQSCLQALSKRELPCCCSWPHCCTDTAVLCCTTNLYLLAVPSAVACCRDLRVACKTPFSGVHCQQVEAFCSNDQPAPVLAAWTKHMLLRSDCSAYSGMPYLYMSLQQMQAAAQESAAAAARQQAEQPAVAEALLLREMLHSMAQEVPAGAAVSNAVSTLQQRHLIITLAAIAAGALCVAVVAVMFALRREEASGPITSAAPMPSLCATDEYQALLRDKALTAPQPAACIGSSSMPYSTGLPPRPLPRGGSGSSCLSRVILIGTLSSKGSGTQEPLLQEVSQGQYVALLQQQIWWCRAWCTLVMAISHALCNSR